MDQNLLYKDECYKIQGAVFEVYRNKGCGFLEAVYQECLEIEFINQNISYLPQPELQLDYKGQRLRQTYKPDFVCYDSIIVELKALKMLSSEHDAQVLNYLKSTGHRVGLLVNFGHYPKAQIKRIIL
ncbi:MAG: GxxExxY protein [Opitutales bacterium]